MTTSRPAVAIIGMGKMGRAVEERARERGWKVTATLTEHDTPITPERLHGADVAIEFTEPGAAVANIRACLAARCPVVVGTTGWYADLPAIEKETTQSGGTLLWSANYSLGAQILIALAARAAQMVRASQAGFDAHIIETHHAAKKDAPSGTAAMIEKAASSAWGAPIPIASVRVGHVPGVHELLFDGAYEQLQLQHTVRDRRVFAEGALVAAAWLVAQRRTGVFTMRDVLTDHDGADA